MSQQLKNFLQWSKILDSAKSLKLVPIKSWMDMNSNLEDQTQSASDVLPSESGTIQTPHEVQETSRGPSRAHMRWAASMHVMYSIRMFESYLHNPFYSLVFSLRCLGISINLTTEHSNSALSRRSPIRRWIARLGRYALTSFMLIYILYYAIKTTVTVTYGGIWTNLKVVINAWITLLTVVLFLLRHNQIGALMAHIQSVNAFVRDHTPQLKRNVLIGTGGTWIYLALSIIIFFIDFSYKKSEDLFSEKYGQWQVSSTMGSLILYLDTILSVYFVSGTLIFIVVLYILLCHSLEHLYTDLKDFSTVQHKQKRQLTLRGLRELRNRHQLLAVYCEELDYIFSLLVFLWYILIVVSLCVRINTIIAGEYSSANIEGWFSSIWSIGLALLIYIGIPLSASFLTIEANHSALSVEQLATINSRQIEANFYSELLLFITRVSISPVVLTCYKFFPIQKCSILIIGLIVIAYYLFTVHLAYVVSNIEHKST